MSRTRVLAALATVLALVLLAPAPRAQQVTQINGIGMVDYSAGRSVIKVGSWAKYHLHAKSELGVIDDYTVTVLIAGEEEWWGEDCFWVETWTDAADQAPRTAATLMSYAIFDDSLAVPHMQVYMRKTIIGVKPDGSADEQLYKRAAQSLKTREPLGGSIHWNVDSLGTETIKTVKGDFTCRKVKIEQGTGLTSQGADSSLYTEVRETRTIYLTPAVPLTHVAREEIDYGAWRRTWLIGRSEDSGPLRVMDTSKGVGELEGFGVGGLTPRLVPPERRFPIAEQRAREHKAASPAPGRTRRGASRPG